MFHKIFINASLLSILLFGSVYAVQTVGEDVQDLSESQIVANNEINDNIIDQEDNGDNSLIVVASDEIDENENISLNIEESEEVRYVEEGPFVHFSKKSDQEFFKGFKIREFSTSENGGIKEIDNIIYLYAFDLEDQPSYGAAAACESMDNVKLKFTGLKTPLGDKCFRATYHIFTNDNKFDEDVYLFVSTKSPVIRTVLKDCVFSFAELSENNEFFWRSASHNKVFKCSVDGSYQSLFKMISKLTNENYELKIPNYTYPNQSFYEGKLYSNGELKRPFTIRIKSIN
ncbi:MAG: hypothetical protein Q8L85_03365 [Alphaproteobacteria bacterium]|nr:hypothetical protein [Alphaproteobacteria bacterium]